MCLCSISLYTVYNTCLHIHRVFVIIYHLLFGIPQLSYPPSCHCRAIGSIHGTRGTFTYILLVDFYGFHVGKVCQATMDLPWDFNTTNHCSFMSLRYTIKGGRFVYENSDEDSRVVNVWHIATPPGVTCDDAWRSLLDPTLECFLFFF